MAGEAGINAAGAGSPLARGTLDFLPNVAPREDRRIGFPGA